MTLEIDHTMTKKIVCPHCGHEYEDSWEMGQDGEEQCSECGKIFEYALVDVICYYSTKKKTSNTDLKEIKD